MVKHKLLKSSGSRTKRQKLTQCLGDDLKPEISICLQKSRVHHDGERAPRGGDDLPEADWELGFFRDLLKKDRDELSQDIVAKAFNSLHNRNWETIWVAD